MNTEEIYSRSGRLTATIPVFDPMDRSGQIDGDTAIRTAGLAAALTAVGNTLANLCLAKVVGAINNTKIVLNAALSADRDAFDRNLVGVLTH